MSPDFSSIKAVIFDMDGVLFLSSDCHERAYRDVLAKYGIMDFSYQRVGAGMRTDTALKQIFAEAGRDITDSELNQLVTDKQTRARQLLAVEGKVATDSDMLLETLHQKYAVCLASSASRGTLDIYLSKAKNPNIFAFCLDGSCVLHAKPAPDIYLLAAEKLGVPPEGCIVIEDSLSGIQAGASAGMPVVAVVGDQAPQPFFDSGATVVVSGLKDVLALFDEETK